MPGDRSLREFGPACRRLRRDGLIFGVLALALCAGAAAISFTRGTGSDYANLSCQEQVSCDDAAPAVSALSRGDFADYAHHQPLMGPVSIGVRAIAVAISGVDRGRTRLVYEIGVFPCLLFLVAAALLVAIELRRLGRPLWQGGLIAVLIVVNPVTFRALHFGHPEEALGAALCVVAALCVLRKRPLAAACLIGAAIATKLWALVVVVPLLVAVAPAMRIRAALAIVATAGVLYAPAVAADPGRFWTTVDAARRLGTAAGTVTSANAWWFLAHNASFTRLSAIANGHRIYDREQGFRLQASVVHLTRPVLLIVTIAVALLWLHRQRRGREADVLALLALVLLLRCVLDPGNYSYYHLPFLVCLLACDGLRRQGLPLGALAGGAGLSALIVFSPQIHSDTLFAWLYLGWAAAAAALVVAWMFTAPPARRDNLG